MLDRDRYIPYLSQFIIHQCHHPTLCSLDADSSLNNQPKNLIVLPFDAMYTELLTFSLNKS
jgi:hypothetical protein